MKNKTLSTLKSELLKEFKEKKWWVGFKSRVTSTGDAKLTEKELWSFISSALDTVVGETMEGIVGRIEDMVERIHTKHYARWIPTEEQKGYRKCQMDIIKSFKRDKWLKGEK